jgi:hypothetical protein
VAALGTVSQAGHNEKEIWRPNSREGGPSIISTRCRLSSNMLRPREAPAPSKLGAREPRLSYKG